MDGTPSLFYPGTTHPVGKGTPVPQARVRRTRASAVQPEGYSCGCEPTPATTRHGWTATRKAKPTRVHEKDQSRPNGSQTPLRTGRVRVRGPAGPTTRAGTGHQRGPDGSTTRTRPGRARTSPTRGPDETPTGARKVADADTSRAGSTSRIRRLRQIDKARQSDKPVTGPRKDRSSFDGSTSRYEPARVRGQGLDGSTTRTKTGTSPGDSKRPTRALK